MTGAYLPRVMDGAMRRINAWGPGRMWSLCPRLGPMRGCLEWNWAASLCLVPALHVVA